MKKFSAFLTICCIAFLLPSYLAKAQTTEQSDSSAASIADSLVNYAHRYLGVPYRLGAKGPSSFDCSGFTRFVYDRFGYNLPASSASQFTEGRQVTGSFSELQKGDVLVFASRHSYSTPGHVAIYIGPDDNGDGFNFIHASVRDGITVNNIKDSYYSTRFLGARRFLPDIVSRPDSVLSNPDSLCIPGTQPDTARLEDSAKYIVLREDGSWAYVKRGNLVAPGADDKILLSPDGSWLDLPDSENKIPDVRPEKPAASAGTASKNTSASQNVSKPKAVYHTIKSGDTLSGIAARYHSSVRTLCRLNGLSEKSILKIGKKIRVK